MIIVVISVLLAVLALLLAGALTRPLHERATTGRPVEHPLTAARCRARDAADDRPGDDDQWAAIAADVPSLRFRAIVEAADGAIANIPVPDPPATQGKEPSE